MDKVENARKFTFDIGWATASLAAMMIVGLILGVLLGNYFDASGLGAYSMVLTIWTIASLTAGIGIPLAVIKYVAEHEDKPRIWNPIVSSAMLFGFMTGTLATIVLFILSPFIESLFNIPDLGNLLRIVSISFPFVVVNEVYVGTLNALRKMRHYSILETFRRGMILVFTLILIWSGMEIAGAVLALVLAPITTTLVVLATHKKIFTFKLKRVKKTTKILAKFGGQLYLASGIALINSHAATLLIGFYLTGTDVGIYAAALMFFNAMIMIPKAIQKVTFPAFATHFAKKRMGLIKRMMKLVMRASFILMSLGCFFLLFYFDDVIRFIFPGKDDFLLAVAPLKILAVIAVPYGIIVPIGAIFVSVGRADIPLKISILQASVNIGLAVLLIPISLVIWGFEIGGLNGAALALAANFVASIFLTFMLLRPAIKMRIRIKKTITGLGIFSIFLLTVMAILTYTDIHENILGLIIIPVYAGCLILSGVLSKDMWGFVRQVMGKNPSAKP